MVKPRLYDSETKNVALWTLKTVLIDILKLLHPFMPFITEEIFTHIQEEEKTIMLSSWPEYTETKNFVKEEKEIELIKESVKNIRNIRSEMNVPPSKKVKIFVVSTNENIIDIFKRGSVFFSVLARASDIVIQKDKLNIEEDAISVIVPNAVIYMPLSELVDINKEIERLTKEKDRLINEVERVNKKLNNQGFTSKAPIEVIQEEKAKQEKYNNMLKQVEAQLESLRVK